MITEGAVWGIIALPLGAALFLGTVLRLSRPSVWRLSGAVAVLSIGGSFLLSLWALASAVTSRGAVGFEPHDWLVLGVPATGAGFGLQVGILLDPLSAVMAVLVSGVSLLVQVYSIGYMVGDGRTVRERFGDYPRYFAYMSLFTAAMLGLVLSRNLIQLYAFWEMVGLSSYLLIGFWHHRPAASAAAKKAFVVTRIGDVGFLLAMLYLFLHRSTFVAEGMNPFDIPSLNEAATMALLPAAVAMWLSLGLLAGAAGKSAQFPLHTWLPDAMEGPTPVSSLIHAATMVAAGVFLVARVFPLFEASTAALNTVALIGGSTAVLAASMGLVANDIKRVLAYSTISQLGLMMIALGVGEPAVAVFHLLTHAFFKCLLFLGAGSVHHATGTFDLRYMGGLRAVMPLTYGAMVLAALSLGGFFPLAGFWSKDEILAVAWAGEHAGSPLVARSVFALGLAASFMTAFYMFRVIHLTFHGSFRGGAEAEHEQQVRNTPKVHLRESPWVMVAPMLVLTSLSVASGYALNGVAATSAIPAHWLPRLLGDQGTTFNLGVAVVSSLLALGGVALAAFMLRSTALPVTDGRSWRRRLHVLLAQRYYLDWIYEELVARRLLQRGLFRATDWLDVRVVDGTVDLLAWAGRNAGRAAGQLQTGQVQAYGVGIALGAIILLVVYLAQR